MSVIGRMAEAISADLLLRLPGQRATQRRKLSELAAGMLVCQTPNLMELSNVLDRPTECPDARYNYAERFLKNALVDCGTVMAAYARELLERLAKHQHTLILMIDQTKINDGNELLMVSVRVRKRAVPLLWKAKDTKGGGMGFDEQEKLLDVVRTWIPEGTGAMLAGDRFYGTADLISYCQTQGWKYRIRLKGNLRVFQDKGPDKSLDELKAEGALHLEKARMRTGVVTHVGFLHEKGHKEPWYIAMDSAPSEYKTRDYGMRWGIEAMFSDFKSRGFGITDTKIRISERLERLILVLAVALYWAVSVGFWHESERPGRTEKKGAKNQKDPVSRFLNAVYAFSDEALRAMTGHRLFGAL